MPVTLYQCVYCGMQYQDETQAVACEEAHLQPVEMIDVRYSKENQPKYPSEINVTLSDGSVLTFYRSRNF